MHGLLFARWVALRKLLKSTYMCTLPTYVRTSGGKVGVNARGELCAFIRIYLTLKNFKKKVHKFFSSRCMCMWMGGFGVGREREREVEFGGKGSRSLEYRHLYPWTLRRIVHYMR